MTLPMTVAATTAGHNPVTQRKSVKLVDASFISIARVAKTQGRHGEVAADLHTDFPEKFAERKRLYALLKDGSHRELQVEDHWPHKGMMVLKFAGVDSIDEAEALKGCELQIPISERAPLEAGATYISDLVGIKVWNVASGKESEVGEIKAVEFGSGEAPTLVVKSGGKEFLIPYAEPFLLKLDVAGKRMVMELPEGLLELDARPRAEEKRRAATGRRLDEV